MLTDADGEPLDDLPLVLPFPLACCLPGGQGMVVGGSQRLEVVRVETGLLQRSATATQAGPLLVTRAFDERAERQLDVLRIGLGHPTAGRVARLCTVALLVPTREPRHTPTLVRRLSQRAVAFAAAAARSTHFGVSP